MSGRPLFLAILLIAFSGMVIATGGMTYTAQDAQLRVTDGSRALLAYDTEAGMERYVLQPVFTGNVSDFGFVVPTPSRPVLTVREERPFRKITEITAPQSRGSLLPVIGGSGGTTDVTVVDRETVGDVDATVLTANTSTALLQWLQNHGYQVRESSRENLRYYAGKDGYYFTALRINASRFTCDGGQCGGRLAPVELRFRTDSPYIPLRIRQGNHTGGSDGQPRFQLYTLSAQPLIVEGATVEYANVVDEDRLPNYSAAGRFLVSQKFQVDNVAVRQDLSLKKTELFHIGAGERAVVNPFDGTRNGVVSDSGQGYLRKHSGTMRVATGTDPGLIDRSIFVLEAVIPLL